MLLLPDDIVALRSTRYTRVEHISFAALLLYIFVVHLLLQILHRSGSGSHSSLYIVLVLYPFLYSIFTSLPFAHALPFCLYPLPLPLPLPTFTFCLLLPLSFAFAIALNLLLFLFAFLSFIF